MVKCIFNSYTENIDVESFSESVGISIETKVSVSVYF